MLTDRCQCSGWTNLYPNCFSMKASVCYTKAFLLSPRRWNLETSAIIPFLLPARATLRNFLLKSLLSWAFRVFYPIVILFALDFFTRQQQVYLSLSSNTTSDGLIWIGLLGPATRRATRKTTTVDATRRFMGINKFCNAVPDIVPSFRI